MAVDSSGVVFLSHTAGQKYFTVDPQTGVTTLLGNTNIPNAICADLAFDASDRLWGVFYDAAGGPNSGIYRIDLATMTTHRLVGTNKYHLGIAFTRDTATQPYCTPKTTSLGCVPTIAGFGYASVAARSGFTIEVAGLNNQRPGLLFYGASGRAAIPFQGGLLCLAPPLKRSSVAATGGSSLPALDCTGYWVIDYNTMIWDRFAEYRAADRASLPAFLLPGSQVQCQWWGRDPGFAAPNNSMLSDALEFTLAP